MRITKSGGSDVDRAALSFDMSGSSPPCQGPMNSVIATTRSSIYLAIKHVFPEAAINAGTFEPLHIVDPEGTFLYAHYPRPVSGCAAEVSQRIAEAVFAALGQGDPRPAVRRAGRHQRQPRRRRLRSREEPRLRDVRDLGRRLRRQPVGDGISNGCSTIGISKTTPIEIMEQLYPVLFEEYSLHEGSGGAGEHRGGFGVNYRIRLRRGEARVSMVMDHGRAGPPGAQGGGAGGVNKVSVIRDGVVYVPPHLSKDQDIEIHAGDVIAVSTPGGGGFGPGRRRGRPRRARARRRARLLQRRPNPSAPSARQAMSDARAADASPARASASARSTPQTGWCEGCLRTIDEIAAWGALDERARREIWKRLPARRDVARRAADAGGSDDEDRRLLVRSGLALRVPGVRAPARSLRRPVVQRRLPADRLRRAAEGVRPQGPGRDRAQARLDLSPGALARPSRRHRDRDAGAPSVQPDRAVAPGMGDGARGRDAGPLRLRARSCATSGAAAPTPRIRSASPRSRRSSRRASIRRATRSSSACATRPTRRSHAASSACRRSASTTSCSGASTRSTWPPRSCAAIRGSTSRTGSAKARRGPGSCAAESAR